jgi:hypothetical protein
MPKLNTQRQKRKALKESPSPPTLIESEDGTESLKRAKTLFPSSPVSEDAPQTSLSEYELERKKRIEQNEAFKRTLGLSNVSFQVASKPQVLSKKRVVASEPSRKSLRLKRAQDPSLEIYSELEDATASPEAVARRGARLYDPVNGVTCHQCRQKTLDPKSICANEMTVGSIYRHKYCGSCLRNRYSENIEEVNQQKNWLCPFCRGDCDCSICKKKQKCKPTKVTRKLRKHVHDDDEEEEQPPSPVSSSSPPSSPVSSPVSSEEAITSSSSSSIAEEQHQATQPLVEYTTEIPLSIPLLPELPLPRSERLTTDAHHPDPSSFTPTLIHDTDYFSSFGDAYISPETEVIFGSLPPLFSA